MPDTTPGLTAYVVAAEFSDGAHRADVVHARDEDRALATFEDRWAHMPVEVTRARVMTAAQAVDADAGVTPELDERPRT